MIPADYIREFKSVKISHDIMHRIDYCFIAEFFRFMGILVCEDILVERLKNDKGRTDIERNTRYDAHIYVGERRIYTEEAYGLGVSAEVYEEYIARLPEQTIFLYDASIWPKKDSAEAEAPGMISHQFRLIKNLPKDDQENILYRLLSEVFRTAFIDREEGKRVAGQLQELIHIYVEDELWFHSMNLQYYHKRKSDAEAKAKEAFFISHDQVKELLAEKSNTNVEHWYKYAWLWCEMKVNTACDYEKNVIYFLIDNVSARCTKLIEEYPWFSNLKVLHGLCFEPAYKKTNSALFAFAEAVPDLKDECFAASVYYWMGKRYEAYPDKIADAKHCYQLAEKRQSKFRTIFKLAVIARDENDYEKALRLFNVIIDRLDLKMQLEFTDPLELEYLFKAYMQQSYIYNKTGKDERAVETAQKAKWIASEGIAENIFFQVFYGDNADAYRGMLRDRMNLEMADWIIRNSGIKCRRVDEGTESIGTTIYRRRNEKAKV